MTRSILINRNRTNETTRRTIARESVGHSLTDKSQALIFGHSRSVILIHPGVQEDGTATAHSIVALDHGSTKGDVVDGSTVDGVVAADDDAGLNHEAVVVAHLSEEGGNGLDWDGAFVVGVEGVLAHVAGDHFGEGLSVCGGTGAAAVDVVDELGELVGDTVDDVSTGGGAGVGGEDHTAVIGDGDNGGTKIVTTTGLRLVGVFDLRVFDGAGDREQGLGGVEGTKSVIVRALMLEVLRFLNEGRCGAVKHD